MTPAPTPPRPLCVLVVEDDPDGARMLARCLQAIGHQAVVAADGLAGLDAALECAPDVLLADIGLPALDGWELAERLLRRLPFRPLLVAVTARGTPEDRARSTAAGFDHHLVKPVDFRELE